VSAGGVLALLTSDRLAPVAEAGDAVVVGSVVVGVVALSILGAIRVTRASRNQPDRRSASLIETMHQSRAARDVAANEPPDLPASAAPPPAQYVARMGHELRTPLNSVIGFSSVLLKNAGGNLSTQQLLFLSRIRDNGVHLLALVDHLLDVSDQGTGTQRVRLTPVSVDHVVRGTLQELAHEAAEDHVTVESVLPDDLLPLTTDAHRFQTALRSLVRGALPLAEHGSLTVRVAAAPRGRPERIDIAVSGPAVAREPDTAPTTLATSLYHLLGFPVTTEPDRHDGTTISVHLAPDGQAATLATAATNTAG
jgi:signal transduction histidine kinase